MKPPRYHRLFGYNTNLLPNRYLAQLEHGVSTIEEATKRTGFTIGYPGWGVIYYLLLSHLDRSKKEIIIETGTNWGSTTIILAQALVDAGCDGTVITVELEEDNAARARQNFTAAGLAERIDLRVGNSRNIVPDIAANLRECRFAFLDASHLFDDVMHEFETILPSLADDALVVFDNTYQIADAGEDQRVNGALRAIRKQYGGNLINLEFLSWFTPGLAIWQKVPKLNAA